MHEVDATVWSVLTVAFFVRLLTEMREVDMEDLLRVGVISSTHGIRGEVKVYPTTDDVRRFDMLKEAIIQQKTKGGVKDISVEVIGAKYFKNMVILKFKGYDTIESVEPFRQCDLCVTRENAVPLEEDEYFITDLLGLQVVTEDGTILGELTDVLQTGANDVYEVTTLEGKEILLPVIDECVLDISLEERKCVVRLMPGLLDD